MVDLIRSGKAPEVIRRRGAEGSLPLPVEDKIEILALLIHAPEEDLRAMALHTLQKWDFNEVRRVLASPLTAPDVLRTAAEHLVATYEGLREVLLWNPSLPEETRLKLQPKPAPKPAPEEVTEEILARLVATLHKSDAQALQNGQTELEVPEEITKHDDELTAKDREYLIEKVGRMDAVEKIKAALTGNLETRMLLIRDSNKIVARAVMLSPKVSESEVEGYAAAKNVSEDVLRLIAMNRKYMKSYVVLRALVNNPRAPIDVSLPLLNRLNDPDLKGVAVNRNVADVIRTMAAKLIKQKEDANKFKPPSKY